MIDERHVLINGECLISVYCEDYCSGTSGGVAVPPHYAADTAPAKNLPDTLGLIFNQGLSGT